VLGSATKRTHFVLIRHRWARGSEVGEYFSVEHIFGGAVLLVEYLQVALSQLRLLSMRVVKRVLVCIRVTGHFLLGSHHERLASCPAQHWNALLSRVTLSSVPKHAAC
jgi:hypothetical protein